MCIRDRHIITTAIEHAAVLEPVKVLAAQGYEAVSYTHLDVYKRQILFRGVRVEKGAKVSGCVLMQGTAVQAGAVLKYAITDKNVRVNPGRMLMGHNTYPLSIAKNEIV